MALLSVHSLHPALPAFMSAAKESSGCGFPKEFQSPGTGTSPFSPSRGAETTSHRRRLATVPPLVYHHYQATIWFYRPRAFLRLIILTTEWQTDGVLTSSPVDTATDVLFSWFLPERGPHPRHSPVAADLPVAVNASDSCELMWKWSRSSRRHFVFLWAPPVTPEGCPSCSDSPCGVCVMRWPQCRNRAVSRIPRSRISSSSMIRRRFSRISGRSDTDPLGPSITRGVCSLKRSSRSRRCLTPASRVWTSGRTYSRRYGE